jgi:C4-dicarboxylate-specific signal transduction histidine kinase
VRSELAHVARVATLGALTASIAHEVNQPLSGIVTNAGTSLRLLGDTPPNIEAARETARRTIRDAHRASEVIARLRTLFSKSSHSLAPVDLNAATREVLALLRGELQRERVRVLLSLDPSLPPVRGDRVQLQQVVLNLLRNGFEAMSEVTGRARVLSVRTEPEGGERVRLTVQDNGPGFDAATADRMFEAFYTTKRDGMGMGLSISRAIIESLHGKLWASTSPDTGASFAFSIPRAEPVEG